MQEGDAAAAPVTTEASSATATLEPTVESSDIQGVPAPDHAEPGSVEPASEDTPHIALHAEDNQMAPEASTATTEMSDDEAAAKLSGDEKTEEATTDPSDSAMDSGNTDKPTSFIPTTKIEPTEPRVQPEEKSDIDATTTADDTMGESTTETSSMSGSDAATEAPAETTSNEHFVLGGQHEAQASEDIPAPADDDTAEATPAVETASSEESIDTTIEAAMSKIKEAAEMLKAEKEKIAARIQEHEQAETEARTKKEQDQQELSRVEDELGKLDKLQPAA